MRRIFGLALWLAALAPLARAQPAGIPPGDSRQVASVGGVDLTVYLYRPEGCEPTLALLVFHGVGRRAAPYRRHAKPLADSMCAVIAAPQFDKARFPTELYQYGGVTRQAPGARTVDLVPLLEDWTRHQTGEPGMRVVLLGHSGGAQFLDRVAAFVKTDAVGVVIANPSTWVLPSLSVDAPFGLGATSNATEAALRAYLAAPVAVLLGTADTGTKELAMDREAMAQGENRHVRGLNTFRMAQEVARSHGWSFGWTLSEVPDVGHDATAMFASAQALAALQHAVSGPAR